MKRIPAAERRDRLVAAALRVVARDGVAAATTRRIVAEAGMSLASFHYVFTSRDELMAELVNAAVAGEESDLAPAFEAVEPPAGLREVVRAGLQHYFDGVRADPDREKAMFELTQWALREPGFEHLARRQYERYHRTAEEAARTAARLTGTEWNRPLPEIARTLVALTDGLTIAWLVTGDDEAATATMDFAADALTALAAATAPTATVAAPVAAAPAPARTPATTPATTTPPHPEGRR